MLHMYNTKVNHAPVAQWIERIGSNDRVGGSNPSGSANPGNFDFEAILRLINHYVSLIHYYEQFLNLKWFQVQVGTE